MDRDKTEEIAKLLFDRITMGNFVPDNTWIALKPVAQDILSLLAPELEKARILNDKIGHLVGTDIATLVEKAAKWDKVKEIANAETCEGCYYVLDTTDCALDGGCAFWEVINALT